MNHEQRNGMRHRRGRYPLAAGIVASALLHLVLVLLNPAMVVPWYGRPGGTPSAPGAQFTVLSLSPDDEDDLIPMEATPPTVTPPTTQFGTPGTAPDDAGGSVRAVRPERGADATVAERLRYNTRPFSKPVPMLEPEHRRATRETGERVLRAAEELGPLPPVGVARRGGGGGISIPFGFGPPPPAITVPAPPLPDSILRQDSIRAAARLAARRDSLRAARDTTKLRNVAPRKPPLLRRVLPDTTAR